MITILRADSGIGEKVGVLIYRSLKSTGVFVRPEMPEDPRPKGVRKGSRQHQSFITSSVAIDHQHDANTQWKVSRATFKEPIKNCLFIFRSIPATGLRVKSTFDL
jgi:hypothetical protein